MPSLCSLVCPNWDMLKLEWQNHVRLKNSAHAVRLYGVPAVDESCWYNHVGSLHISKTNLFHDVSLNLIAKHMGFIDNFSSDLKQQPWVKHLRAVIWSLQNVFFAPVGNCWAVTQGRPSATTLHVMLERYWKGHLIHYGKGKSWET